LIRGRFALAVAGSRLIGHGFGMGGGDYEMGSGLTYCMEILEPQARAGPARRNRPDGGHTAQSIRLFAVPVGRLAAKAQ